MGKITRPFDFAEFGSAALDENASEARYSQADFDNAVAAAKEDTLREALASEAARQTELLRIVAETLKSEADADKARILDHVNALTIAAQTIVEEVCVGAVVKTEQAAALALIEKFFAASVDKAHATLLVSNKTPKTVRTKIKDALSERGADDLVRIELTTALEPGDVRLEWRGGAIERRRMELKSQIDAIFGAVSRRNTSRTSAKGELAK